MLTRILGGLQFVSGQTAVCFRDLDLGNQSAALLSERGRRVFQLRTFALGVLDALLKGSNLSTGAVTSFVPALGFGRDGLQAAIGKLGLAGNGLLFGA